MIWIQSDLNVNASFRNEMKYIETSSADNSIDENMTKKQCEHYLNNNPADLLA